MPIQTRTCRYSACVLAALLASAIILGSVYSYSLGTVHGLADCARGGESCLRSVEAWVYTHVLDRYPPDGGAKNLTSSMDQPRAGPSSLCTESGSLLSGSRAFTHSQVRHHR